MSPDAIDFDTIHRRDFYPAIEPFHSGYLPVSDLHKIYFEEVGNPQGKPILFLHGGPGGGCNSDHRRFFDPDHYRIILFDQRGCGRSEPFAELSQNTTWDLVSDIEKLRGHLGIKQWHVFGGSWGSTLALSYAVTHPDYVTGLILRGIFLCRPLEIRWFYQEGASFIFPDAWAPYRDFIPPEEHTDFLKAYYKRLTGQDENLKLQAAQIWSQWEMATSYLLSNPSAVNEMEDPRRALPFARIEAHYFMNNAFFKTDNFLLENAGRIQHIPTVIVQGRYDVVCPMKSAFELKQKLPEAKLLIVPDAGHAASEPGTRSALVQSTDFFRNL
jgi:proline iminopeptidase